MNAADFWFSSPQEFRPAWWLRGPHVQTIVPYFFPTEAGPYRAVAHRLQLEDGDTIVLHEDRPEGWSESDRSIVLVHGLGGCHASSYMVRLAESLVDHRFRVWRMDMRGCGAGLRLATGVFHADRSSDLLHAIRYIADRSPASPLTLIGFSLGANLTLKMLGTSKAEIPPTVDSAIVVSPPVDLGYCCHMLSRGWGWIYDAFFARILWRDFQNRRDIIRGADRVRVTRPPRTLLEFDQLVTAPIAGFESADAYYKSANSKDVVDAIEVPTAILTAADDPIVPALMYENVAFSTTTQLFVADGGGHLGFYGLAVSESLATPGGPAVGRQSAAGEEASLAGAAEITSMQRPMRWMEHQIEQWLLELNQVRVGTPVPSRSANS